MSEHDFVSESDFQNEIMSAARNLGWMIFHPANDRRNCAGFPDLVMAKNGRVIFAELKTEKGRIRPEQIEWHKAIGESAHIWRPSDWNEILLELASKDGR